jgi:hypothetical protein
VESRWERARREAPLFGAWKRTVGAAIGDAVFACVITAVWIAPGSIVTPILAFFGAGLFGAVTTPLIRRGWALITAEHRILREEVEELRKRQIASATPKPKPPRKYTEAERKVLLAIRELLDASTKGNVLRDRCGRGSLWGEHDSPGVWNDIDKWEQETRKILEKTGATFYVEQFMTEPPSHSGGSGARDQIVHRLKMLDAALSHFLDQAKRMGLTNER